MNAAINELDNDTLGFIAFIGWYLITAIGAYGIFRKAQQATGKAFIPIANFR